MIRPIQLVAISLREGWGYGDVADGGGGGSSSSSGGGGGNGGDDESDDEDDNDESNTDNDGGDVKQEDTYICIAMVVECGICMTGKVED